MENTYHVYSSPDSTDVSLSISACQECSKQLYSYQLYLTVSLAESAIIITQLVNESDVILMMIIGFAFFYSREDYVSMCPLDRVN